MNAYVLHYKHLVHVSNALFAGSSQILHSMFHIRILYIYICCFNSDRMVSPFIGINYCHTVLDFHLKEDRVIKLCLIKYNLYSNIKLLFNIDEIYIDKYIIHNYIYIYIYIYILSFIKEKYF